MVSIVIALAIVGVAIWIRSGWRPSMPRRWGSLIGLGIVLLAGWGVWKLARPDNKPAEKPAAAVVGFRVEIVREKVGKEKQLYRFSEWSNGCAMMELRSDASFYPKGGWVTIHPPKPALPWDDAPGIVTDREGSNQPPGWYTVCEKKSDKGPAGWGVEVWN